MIFMLHHSAKLCSLHTILTSKFNCFCNLLNVLASVKEELDCEREGQVGLGRVKYLDI